VVHVILPGSGSVGIIVGKQRLVMGILVENPDADPAISNQHGLEARAYDDDAEPPFVSRREGLQFTPPCGRFFGLFQILSPSGAWAPMGILTVPARLKVSERAHVVDGQSADGATSFRFLFLVGEKGGDRVVQACTILGH
jgi:hypothetical protein